MEKSNRLLRSNCEACLCRDLLSDDAEWKRALQDVFELSFQPQKKLFAIIFGTI